MTRVTVHCPRCQSSLVYRQGQNPKGHDRFRCRDCHRVFQLTYAYEARKNGFQRCRGSRYRQNTESRYNTVIRTLKRVTSSPVAHADVAFICELDEQ